MSGDKQDLELRKKRIRWRAGHRGMKETDMLFGRLAEEELERMGPEDVTAFERLLEVPDNEFLSWISGAAEIPSGYHGPLMEKLLSYRFGSDRG